MAAASSTFLLPTVTAVAAGLMGCYALMRRMTLAGDALSHVALPGIGLALILRLDPLFGALVALIGGGVFIWMLERRTRIATETVTGVVFSTSLAIGALLAKGETLIDALFGTPGALTSWEIGAGIGGSALVIAFAILARDRLIVTLVSSEIALTSGIRVQRLNLMYLLSFALTVALGLRYQGVLLMGSLVIIPAATARRLARNLTGMFVVSVAVSVFAMLAGTYIAGRLHQPTGPLIVVVASACFLLATLVKPGD